MFLVVPDSLIGNSLSLTQSLTKTPCVEIRNRAILPACDPGDKQGFQTEEGSFHLNHGHETIILDPNLDPSLLVLQQRQGSPDISCLRFSFSRVWPPAVQHTMGLVTPGVQ